MVHQKQTKIIELDWVLLSLLTGLLALGLIMVTSASMGIAERKLGRAFYFTYQQTMAIGIGAVLALGVSLVPIESWLKISFKLFWVAVAMLVLVLIPGIGKTVNGSARWINFGVVTFQVSEFAKLASILYLASFIARYPEEIQTKISGFVKPMLLLSIMAGLLILEPDFGATVVIMSVALAMLFLARVPLWQFMLLIAGVGAGLAFLAISAPYRLKRLTSFLDPWADQFGSGYQLTQALIAFGRGEWFGVGLGSGVQKLFYLPEAHTDFVFAILAEELGLVGALFTILLFLGLFARLMHIGWQAQKNDQIFGAFIVYGISLWIGLQCLINLGVNTGVLPTKGLTLPFISYGKSSIMMLAMAMGFAIRQDFETKRKLMATRNYSRKSHG